MAHVSDRLPGANLAACFYPEGLGQLVTQGRLLVLWPFEQDTRSLRQH